VLDESEFSYSRLSDTEQDVLYQAFKVSYEKATGAAFDKEDFDWRAAGWTFFGNPPNDSNPVASVGGVDVRKQVSNDMVKLVASFGDFRSILHGFDELKQKHRSASVWGIVDQNILKLILKHYKDFIGLPGVVAKAMENGIKKISNGEVKSVGCPCFNLDEIRKEYKYKGLRFGIWRASAHVGFFDNLNPHFSMFNKIARLEIQEPELEF
jgi:hypothetical protein